MRPFFALLCIALFANHALTAPTPIEVKAPSVFTADAGSRPVFDTLSFPAKVVSRTNAVILAETDGVVRKLEARLGQRVSRGTAIVVLENTDPVYQYVPVRARASVAGVVSAIEVTEGARVVKGQRLASVTDPLQLRVQIEVTAGDIGALPVGLAGELRIAGSTTPWPLKVTGISPLVDPATGTATSELRLDVGTGALPAPGGVGRVAFRVREHLGFELPEDAIVYRGSDPMVRLVVEGKAVYTPVTLGPMREGKIEILQGLKGGEKIIVRASDYVRDGEAVALQEGPQS